MIFNDHRELEGMHAFLSPSTFSWVNYTDEKLEYRYRTHKEAARGTRLHEFAKEAILLGQKLPRSNKTLNKYINDAIGYRMTPEQILFYSYNCFGTADAIKYDAKNNTLLIHDLKTGVTKASMMQLRVYVAIFCLEYDVIPGELDTTLRIYQNDEVWEETPELDDIVHIMDKIQTFDKQIDVLKAEVSK